MPTNISQHSNTAGRLGRIAAAGLVLFAFSAPMFSAPSDARPGRGLSQGSRGLKTYNPPPSTQTAPGSAQSVQRSATPSNPQPGAATAGAAQAARPAAASAAASQTSRFGTGFMAGLLGAGLFGALLGAGMFGNLGSFTAILGLLLQVALIGGLIWFAMSFFRSRRTAATGPQGMNASPDSAAYRGVQRSAYEPAPQSGTGGRIGARIGGSAPSGTTPLTLAPEDFTSFERLLAVVQTAYGREDASALRTAATPEMVGYFQEELEANTRDGVRNELGEPTLLQGDLSEAWGEASGEYATVAMRYSLTDAMVDRASGRIVEGSRTEPVEVTEVWTFVRRAGAGPAAWRLSAIQQVG